MASMQGAVGKIAKPPDCQTGKYQEQLDRALNVEDVKNKEYHIRASLGSRKKNNHRNVDDFPLFPPHECLVDELANSDETHVKLKQRVLANAEYALAYGNNPIVLGSSETERESLLPYAIYLDGTAFSARSTNYDSMTGFFLINMVTGFQHLLANIRKSDYCSCGCNGWCSTSAVFFALRFFLEALASGIYPDGRHDQKPWRASDIRRRAWAGTKLGFRGVCMFIKGDWPELTTTMGLPSWADLLSPCFNCRCTKTHDDMHDY